MADQLTALQLVLDHLRVGNDVSTIDDRIALQKTVCLAQEAGVQLGYSFNWHVRGPYSAALSNDYYQLAGARASVERKAQQYELTKGVRDALEKVAALMSPPEHVTLDRVQWLELLASITFLQRRHRMTKEATKRKIGASKPTLYPFFTKAYAKLKAQGLTG